MNSLLWATLSIFLKTKHWRYFHPRRDLKALAGVFAFELNTCNAPKTLTEWANLDLLRDYQIMDHEKNWNWTPRSAFIHSKTHARTTDRAFSLWFQNVSPMWWQRKPWGVKKNTNNMANIFPLYGKSFHTFWLRTLTLVRPPLVLLPLHPDSRFPHSVWIVNSDKKRQGPADPALERWAFLFFLIAYSSPAPTRRTDHDWRRQRLHFFCTETPCFAEGPVIALRLQLE